MTQTIWLEFKHEGASGLAANGTDVTFYIDSRWSMSTRLDKIHERVEELRTTGSRPTAYAKQLFVGYTIAGRSDSTTRREPHVAMNDWNPPAWAANDRGITSVPA